MVPSIGRLLGECIDYSGLTGLQEYTVEETVDRYLRYQSGFEGWVLSRFVCPAKMLHELSENLADISLQVPFPVAVLGRTTSTAAEWEDELAYCAEAMNEFDSATPDLVEVAAFEICPPSSVPDMAILRDLKGFSEVDVFIEAPLRGAWESLLVAIAESDWAMVKLDLSGAKRPDSFAVAKLVHESLALELPFKIVQGKGSIITNSSEIGLINLFGAVAIGMAEDLSKREIEAALIDSEWTHWRFDADKIAYRGWEADLTAIDQAREIILDAQCSSVEFPLEELSTLGLPTAGED